MAGPRAFLAVALVLLAGGCVEIVPATIPDRLLEGRGGNGWEKNLTASQAEPESGSMGLQKVQAFVYEDRIGEPGFQGVLVVTTLRAVPAPSGDRIREHVEASVRDQARAKGIALRDDPAATGTRALANGMSSSYFVYTGNVSTTGFFSRNAEVRILGEVFECEPHKTVVAMVGLAQVTDVRTIRPNPLLPPTQVPGERDDTTWREIVADPSGRVEGARGQGGLAYNVQC